jgi:hypothetical protein
MNVTKICVLSLEQNLYTWSLFYTNAIKNTKFKYLTLYLRQVLRERLNLPLRFDSKKIPTKLFVKGLKILANDIFEITPKYLGIYYLLLFLSERKIIMIIKIKFFEK